MLSSNSGGTAGVPGAPAAISPAIVNSPARGVPAMMRTRPFASAAALSSTSRVSSEKNTALGAQSDRM